MLKAVSSFFLFDHSRFPHGRERVKGYIIVFAREYNVLSYRLLFMKVPTLDSHLLPQAKEVKEYKKCY